MPCVGDGHALSNNVTTTETLLAWEVKTCGCARHTPVQWQPLAPW